MLAKKITNLLTIEIHLLVGSYFFIYISYLLDFYTDDVISFDTKYFFRFKSKNKLTFFSNSKHNLSHTKNCGKKLHIFLVELNFFVY